MKKRMIMLALALSLSSVAAQAESRIDTEFFTTHGLVPLNEEQRTALLKQTEEKLGGSDDAGAYKAMVRISPMAMAVLWVEANEPELERARYRVQLHQNPEDTEHFYLDVLRINMGPLVRAELIESYGAENVESDPRDQHPHRRWRLGFKVGQPTHPPAAASVATVAGSDHTCLGRTCMEDNDISESPLFQGNYWDGTQPDYPVINGEVPSFKESGEPIAQVAWKAESFLMGEGNWAEPREFIPEDWRSTPHVELLAELGAGNGGMNVATICEYNVADDSIKSLCALYSIPEESTQATGHYSRYTICQRGKANSEGLCP